MEDTWGIQITAQICVLEGPLCVEDSSWKQAQGRAGRQLILIQEVVLVA
jgi:hypothetical protein